MSSCPKNTFAFLIRSLLFLQRFPQTIPVSLFVDKNKNNNNFNRVFTQI